MESHRWKLEKAEDEITKASSDTLADLMPQIQRRYHLSLRASTIAVSKAAINTGAMFAVAGTGGTLAAATRIGDKLNEILSKSVG